MNEIVNLINNEYVKIKAVDNRIEKVKTKMNKFGTEPANNKYSKISYFEPNDLATTTETNPMGSTGVE